MPTNGRTLFERSSGADQADTTTLSSNKLAIVVQQSRILDFIDGPTQRRETPEKYVRQEIAKSLVREYRYDKTSISVEFTLRLEAVSQRPIW